MLRLVRTLVTSVAARPKGRGAVPSAPDPRLARTCLDLRPPASLAAGIVDGAWILPAADAPRFAPLWKDVVVLGDRETVETLRAAGLDVVHAPGIAAFVAAGRSIHEPAWKSPLPTGTAVRLGEDEGWVQDVRWQGSEFRFDVRVGPALRRVDDLPEEALVALGGRGAAGLGTVL